MKCADIMTPDPKVCVPEDNVAVAINLMWDFDCGAIPVVKDIKGKELTGMITDRDIAMHVVKHSCMHPAQVKVSNCMSAPAVFCRSDEPLDKAIQLMGERQIRRIPVVDQNGACIGTISQADLLSRAVDIELVIGLLRQISVPSAKPKETAAAPDVAEKAANKKKKKDEE